MGAAIIACGDTAPVLEPAEHGFDAMALAVEDGVVVLGDLAAAGRRYARDDATLDQGSAEPVAVLAAVGDQLAGRSGQVGQQQSRTSLIAKLTFAEDQVNRPALTVADGVQLGLQPALGAADAAGKCPPLSRLAAVRCAFR